HTGIADPIDRTALDDEPCRAAARDQGWRTSRTACAGHRERPDRNRQMLFNTALFALFFVVFFVVFQFGARTRKQKLWCITIGSVLFYAAWDYRFVPLLLGTALVDFYIARAIERENDDQPRRRRLLLVSIVLNLGVLAFFKYTNFALDSVVRAL